MLTKTRRSVLLSAIAIAIIVVLLSPTALAIKEERKMKKTSISKSDDIMSVSKMLKILTGYGESSAQREGDDSKAATAATATAEPTELLVIGAGFGRTGTTSYMAALERLGLQSYHMKAVLGTPGHLDMWIEYLTELKRLRLLNDGQHATRVSREQANQVITGLATAGFDATASFPACLALHDLMERYPNARVVVTVRGDGNGQAWATSILNSVARVLPAIQRIPFRWIDKLQRFSILLPKVWELVGAPVNETTFLPDRDDLARAYDAWLEHVRSVVAGYADAGSNIDDKLLFFAPQHGWQPLCDFISPVHEHVAASCREILEAGEPYPRANETIMVQNLLRLVGVISWTFEHALHFLVGFVVLLVVIIRSRRQRRTAVVDKNKKKD